MKANEIDVVSILTALCRLLARDPLTIEDVRPELADLPLGATVRPEPGTDAPAFVRLTLPQSSRLTLDTLEEAFGPYSRLPRSRPQAPNKFIFYVDLADYPYTCALIAEQALDQSNLQTVAVRRDIRLE